jgi:type IV secretion system protein VirB9
MNRKALPMLGLIFATGAVHAESTPVPGPRDQRIRTAVYNADEVYRITGQTGYQLSLEFAPDETFVGLAAGDVEGLSFESQANHVFIKPRATQIATNLTILTNRRHYYLEYRVASRVLYPDGSQSADPVLYALRFTYPDDAERQRLAEAEQRTSAERIDAALAATPVALNTNYLYCGPKTLKPTSVTDDGIRTRFVFAGQTELPAIFTRAADGTESLVNFTVTSEAVLVHRLATSFILRRGTLVACVLNKGFSGAGEPLTSGTVAPGVTRELPIAPDAHR